MVLGFWFLDGLAVWVIVWRRGWVARRRRFGGGFAIGFARRGWVGGWHWSWFRFLDSLGQISWRRDYSGGCGLGAAYEKLQHVCEHGEEAMIFRQTKASGDSIEIAFEVPEADDELEIRETGAQFAVERAGVIEREGRERGDADGVWGIIGDLAEHFGDGAKRNGLRVLAVDFEQLSEESGDDVIGFVARRNAENQAAAEFAVMGAALGGFVFKFAGF